jgi:hypothetical protein
MRGDTVGTLLGFVGFDKLILSASEDTDEHCEGVTEELDEDTAGVWMIRSHI